MSAEENTREERIRLLVEYEEDISAVSDEIDTALSELQKSQSGIPKQDLLINTIATVLSARLDESEIDEAIYPFVNFILNYEPEEMMALRERPVSDDFVDIMNGFGAKYNELVTNARNQWARGPNFWADANTEIVRRENDQVGLNHTIKTGTSGEFQITTSLTTNLYLIGYLLRQQNRAIGQFTEEANNQISGDIWEEMIEELEIMEEQLNQED